MRCPGLGGRHCAVIISAEAAGSRSRLTEAGSPSPHLLSARRDIPRGSTIVTPSDRTGYVYHRSGRASLPTMRSLFDR